MSDYQKTSWMIFIGLMALVPLYLLMFNQVDQSVKRRRGQNFIYRLYQLMNFFNAVLAGLDYFVLGYHRARELQSVNPINEGPEPE